MAASAQEKRRESPHSFLHRNLDHLVMYFSARSRALFCRHLSAHITSPVLCVSRTDRLTSTMPPPPREKAGPSKFTRPPSFFSKTGTNTSVGSLGETPMCSGILQGYRVDCYSWWNVSPRFRHGYCKGNPRKMVRTWAEKEMRNLIRCSSHGGGPYSLRASCCYFLRSWSQAVGLKMDG